MNLVGYIAGVLTLFAFLPQSFKTIRTGKSRDLSLPTYVLLVLSAFLWVIYGLGNHKLAIYGTNAVVFLLSAIILAMIVRERK